MIELVSALKRASRGEVLRDVPLAPRTSVRVGGLAQLWVRPRDPEALVASLEVSSPSASVTAVSPAAKSRPCRSGCRRSATTSAMSTG